MNLSKYLYLLVILVSGMLWLSASALHALDRTINYIDAESASVQISPYPHDSYPNMFYDNGVHYRVVGLQGGGALPKIVNSPVLEHGASCIEFKAIPDSYEKDRSEIEMVVAPGNPGIPFYEEFYAGYSLYLPSNFASPDSWFVAAQWWQDGSTNPPLAMNLKAEANGKIPYLFEGRRGAILLNGSNEPYVSAPAPGVSTLFSTNLGGDITRNQWIDIVVKFKFDPTGGGYLHLWENGTYKGAYTGYLGLSDGNTNDSYNVSERVNQKFGIYRGQTTTNITHTLYYDEVALGKSYRSVQPGLPKGIAPLAHLQFENNSSNEGFGQDALLGGGASYATDQKARGNTSISLNGSNQYVDLASNGEAFYNEEAYNHTIAMWVKADNTSGTQVLYDRCDTNFGFLLQLVGNTIEANVKSYKPPWATSQIHTASYAGMNTAWTHIAMVYEPGKLHLYVNGFLRSTVNTADHDFIISRGGAYLGARIDGDFKAGIGNGAYFGGRMDDVWIYNKSLTSKEIMSLMHGTGSPETWVKMRNRWNDAYPNDNHSYLNINEAVSAPSSIANMQSSDPISSSWDAAEWILEGNGIYDPTDGLTYYQIKNKETGDYLNVGDVDTDNVTLRSGSGAGWSALWALPSAGSSGGTPLYWLKNRWTRSYIHIETGSHDIPIVTGISGYWGSAKWIKEDTSNGYFRLKNIWKSTHLHVKANDHTHPVCSSMTAVPDLWNMQWKIVQPLQLDLINYPNETQWFTMANRYAMSSANTALVNNTDDLVGSAIPVDYASSNNANPGWWSAHWRFLFKDRTGSEVWHHINNHWQTNEYLHNTSNVNSQGYPNRQVESTTIGGTWWSAQWHFELVE